jgi:hypothetical protein
LCIAASHSELRAVAAGSWGVTCMSIVDKVYFVLPEVVSANMVHETFLESAQSPSPWK